MLIIPMAQSGRGYSRFSSCSELDQRRIGLEDQNAGWTGKGFGGSYRLILGGKLYTFAYEYK